MEVWVYGISALWLWRFQRGTVAISPAASHAWPVLCLMVVWLAYGLAQIAPLPSGWIEWLSPSTAANYEQVRSTIQSAQTEGEDSQVAVHHSLSLDRHASIESWLKSFAYVLVFALTLVLVNSPQRLETLVYVLVISAVLQALWGSFVALAGPSPNQPARGTYVNPNHFAGFLVMNLSIGIGLLLGKMQRGQELPSLRQRVRSLGKILLGPKARLRVYLALMVIALVLSRSRMGNIAFLIGMLVAGGVALISFRRVRRITAILIASLIAIDLLILGSWFGVERIQQEVLETTLATEQRDDVTAEAWRIWQDYPVFGTGLGSFYGTFPRYRQGNVEGFNYHAHNDYVQFLTETGIVGFSLLGLIVVLSLAGALRAQFRRRDPLMRGTAVGATMAIVAMLVHSSVDFNLQIGANGALFMVVLALAWQAGYLNHHPPLVFRT